MTERSTSARVALQLKKRGIKRVRPLTGGLDAWKERNYPVDPPILVQIEGV